MNISLSNLSHSSSSTRPTRKKQANTNASFQVTIMVMKVCAEKDRKRKDLSRIPSKRHALTLLTPLQQSEEEVSDGFPEECQVTFPQPHWIVEKKYPVKNGFTG
jgi:hypothetical protein